MCALHWSGIAAEGDREGGGDDITTDAAAPWTAGKIVSPSSVVMEESCV